MKVCIFGLGVSGRAALEYLQNRGDEVCSLEGDDFFDPKGVDLVVISPGVPLSHPWVKTARAHRIPLVGEIDLGLAELKKRNKKVFGITGSNGKTTTTLLTTHLLEHAGKTAVAVGNIGVPVLSQIENEAEFFVVELSSYQLETVSAQAVLDAAVILNITPNHLDRYPSFEAYQLAKKRIALCLKKEARFYHMQKNGIKFKEKVETILSLGYRDSRSSLYLHDLENLAAAYALTDVTESVLLKAVESFEKPKHRLEWIRTVNGVAFINDSKATSVDAVNKAVESIKAPVVLLCGGVDKGGSFKDWVVPFRNKVIQVFAFGQAARRIQNELAGECSVKLVDSMELGITEAVKIASVGGSVLLSPGCSSFDQFKDYQDRGEKFRQIVEEKL